MQFGTALSALLERLNGPQTFGASPAFWGSLAVAVALAAIYPLFAEPYAVSNFGYLLAWAFLGLSVCILWGYTGVFSFGQTAFFGLAGYAYGIGAINFGPDLSFAAALLSIAAIMILAAIIGYIMFYGGVSALYVAIFTLMLTLLAETLLSRTSGPQFRIGGASMGGSNGMVGIPPLQLSFGDLSLTFVDRPFYWLVLGLLVVTYLGLRWLLNGNWGYLMVATREDPLRTQLFGHDVRWIQLGTYILAAGLAGLGGVLYASWNNFIAPSSMGMTAATLPVIWVAAGGRSSILAVILSTFTLQWINQTLAYSGGQYSLIFFAFLLLGTVLIFPQGIISSVEIWLSNRVKPSPERIQVQ